jgi:hypothetical protein
MPETLQPYLAALAVLFYPEGRIGYCEWTRRNDRLVDIHSVDGRLVHDIDELIA